MKCESARAQLTAYLDGELEDDRGSAVRGHLRGCDACRQVATDEAALRDGLRALPPLDPPPSLWAGIQQQLAAAEMADAERPAWRRVLARWARLGPQIGLAGVALAAAVILLVIRMQRDDAPAVATTSPDERVEVQRDRTPPAPAPAPDEGDVTADLAAEPARVTETYAQTTRELLDLAREARAQWSAERKQEFDSQLAVLEKKIATASDERPRRAAYRAMIRFLQRAVIRDDVALASTGATP